MLPRVRKPTLRILAGGLLSLTLVAGAASGILAQRNSHANATTTTQSVQGGVSTSVVRKGTVNLAKLPVAHTQATAKPSHRSIPTNRPLKTAAQLAAYQQYVKTHPGALPKADAQPAPSGTNTYHSGVIPVLQSKAAGLTSVDGGGGYPPDQAIAAAPNYVFEGVNNVMKVYNSSFSALYGPWTPDTFFASVYRSGDGFSDPQITYDAQRRFWLISWLEINGLTGADYIDIAISKTGAPSPVTNYNVYQVSPQVVNSDYFCDYPTMGYDYWGMYVTCDIFSISNGSFLGNNTYAFSLDNMLSGSLGTWDHWSTINTNLGSPAYRLSPAIEDGSPQAEWIVTTNAGYGVSSNGLTLCSITNTVAIKSGTLPTLKCGSAALPLSYADPTDAAQPGTSVGLYPGIGFKQIVYRSGRLYFAMPMVVNCSGVTHDGIYWADVVPQLTTVAAHNPQWQNGIVSGYSEAGIFCYKSADAYMPTLTASAENDLTLVFNYSSSTSTYPSIVYTGRANTDKPGTMGQGSASHFVVSGTHSNDSHRWGDYSACALGPDGSDRGTVYCAGEFGGPNTVLGGAGWDTELYRIRME